MPSIQISSSHVLQTHATNFLICFDHGTYVHKRQFATHSCAVIFASDCVLNGTILKKWVEVAGDLREKYPNIDDWTHLLKNLTLVKAADSNEGQI